jgi:hypothetical protein
MRYALPDVGIRVYISFMYRLQTSLKRTFAYIFLALVDQLIEEKPSHNSHLGCDVIYFHSSQPPFWVVRSLESCLHNHAALSRVYTTSLGQTKVNVAGLHHYTVFSRLAHFGLEFCNWCCVFLCVVTLSAGWPLISHCEHTLPWK